MKDAYNIDSITITELVYNGLSTKWYFPIVTFTNKEHIIFLYYSLIRSHTKRSYHYY